MPKILKKRSQKIGLPPGALIHIGEERKEEVAVSIIEYDEGHIREVDPPAPGTCYDFKGAPTVTWVNVAGIHQPKILGQIGECFKLHPLVTEDILNSDQRPKMEEYGEDLFFVLKMLSYHPSTGEIAADQVSLILRPNAVISFQEGSADVFAPIRERVQNGQGRLRKMGADYLTYALLDWVVDHYFTVLEQLGDKVEDLEGRLLTQPSTQTMQVIQKLKRDLILLRKWLWPLREVISGLQRGELAIFQPTTRIYLRDVYDHTIQVIDTLELFRDILSGMMDIYLSSINNRMNAIMKVLTIIATIFMPLTFLAGVYGMNFKNMPELDWPFGYPAVLIVMGMIAGVMLLIFWKKKWL
jgi:magnesium transporter